MHLKRVSAFLILMCYIIMTGSIMSGCGNDAVSVLDISGDAIAQLNASDITNGAVEPVYKAYVDAALTQAAQILSEGKDLPDEEAKKLLSGCQIETFLDTKVADNLARAVKNSEVADIPCGAAVTDNRGHLIACYSSDEKDEEGNYLNLSTERQAPYSTLKPLCVYAPAMDSGLLNWSSVYTDKPYKQIEGADGKMTDWPQNANGSYSEKPVTVAQALRLSLNTIPVQILHDYGVNDAVKLMIDRFQMPLDYEYSKAVMSGEDEVIGNVALGYTYAGLSPIELAGYYSAFAAKGVYLAPSCVRKITNNNGETLYEYTDDPVQVYSEETAYIMNKMLQTVADTDGTGRQAYIEDAFVAGKTGTGNSNDGHWFVGTVPQYSCAVWHGGHTERNASPAVFHDIMEELPRDPNADYPWCDGIEECAYCEESGKLASGKCSKVNIGYYPANERIDLCREHQ